MKFPAFILVIALFVSCGQSHRTDRTAQERMEKRKQVELEAKEDSVRMDEALKKALTIANQNIAADTFSREFETAPDSLLSVTVKLEMGNFISNDFKHLIIHRQSINNTYIDIYLRRNNRLEKIASHEQWGLEYTRDTLQDVNGDGFKDFLVNWYGVTGCCLKNFYVVYLWQKDGKFSSRYEFINPTFSSSEQLIRGVEYGHAGETDMYKYKWNGLKVDTLETVYFEQNAKGEKTGKVVIEKHLPKRTIQKVDQVPKEYRRIYGYDWFTGNI